MRKYADNHFWVNVTILNYNLWNAASANLKSLARAENAIKHWTYTTRGYPYMHCLSQHHSYKDSRLHSRWNAQMRVAASGLIEKKQKANVSKAC